MTIAGKINALVVLISVVAGCVLVAATAHREFSSTRDRLIEQSSDKVKSQPQLQVAIYHDDRVELRAIATSLSEISPAILYSIIRDPTGTVLENDWQPDFADSQLPAFQTVRGTPSVADVGITSRHSKLAPDGRHLLNKLTGGDVVWDLTIPIFSVINPLNKDISRAEFGNALANTGKVASLHVIGYAHLGISRTMLLVAILPAVWVAIGTALAFILLCTIFSRFITRKITEPFATIVRMADDIRAGRAIEAQGLEKSGEFKEIVVLLNTIIGGLNTYKTKMDVDHRLLSMRVDERTSQLSKRTSQLSRRNEELNLAVKEVTKTKDRLRQMAYYDSLTALPNRRLFTEQLDLLLRMARRNKETVALLFLDLDNFKRINDSLGHVAGDLLLRQVAKRLSHCVRESDVVGHYVEPNSGIDVSRLGGDEFTVVLNQLDRVESAGTVAQRLLDALVLPMTIEGHEIVVTPSIGIAMAPNDADNVEELLKAADTAMYHAKSSGKNNYVYYASEMDGASVDRLTLETDLRKAIERNELILHYQPQVDISTGSVIGAEALMRWQHPERGLVPPFKFIPLAEEMGLISALGEWGLEEACRQMVELQAEGFELPKVSVNVSALQFNHEFIKKVGAVLADTGLRPMRLELELTEGIMMDGTEAVVRSFEDLKELGVQLSIDDFGTGYSSLSYLSRFPLDELKIDRSFVIDFDKSERDASLVIAIIAMARSMRLKLVAEGVETHDQYQFLKRYGANVIQGFLFSKPVPIEELKPLLKSGYFSPQIREIEGPEY